MLKFLTFFLLVPFFHAMAVPTITEIFPKSFGPSRTATSPNITITGSGFSDVTSVHFGDFSVSFSIIDDSLITIPAGALPPSSPGTVSVSATSPQGPSSSHHPYDYFTFQDSWLAFVPDFNYGKASKVYAFNASLKEQIAAIPSGSGSETVFLTPDGKFAYCVNYTSNTLTIIDTAYNSASHTIQFDFPKNLSQPIGCAISPGKGNALLIVFYGSGTLLQLDITDRQHPQIVKSFSVGSNPTSVGFLPNSTTAAYVTNFNSKSISIIELPSSIVQYTDTTLENPSWIAPFPVNESADNHQQIVLDSTLNAALFYPNFSSAGPLYTVTGLHLNEPNFFPQVLSSPDGTTAYITNTHSGNISLIDLTTTPPTLLPSSISTPPYVNGISITPDGLLGYTGNGSSSDKITIFDTKTLETTSKTIGGNITNPGISPDQSPVAYATFAFSNSDTVLFDASDSLSPTGTISKYVWDFGDGSPLFTTTSPTASHTYPSNSNQGSYTVTLTVTNSAGTSSQQTHFGQMVYQNGGPQATLSFPLTLFPLLPPSSATITQRCQKGSSNSCFENTIHISPPSSGTTPVAYLVYLDPTMQTFVSKASAIDPSALIHCQKDKHATYYIFSIDASGAISSTYTMVSN